MFFSEREGLTKAYVFHEDGVKWDAAANGYRLPTEAEWEYAARTREDLHFVGSDSFDEVAHCEENSSELADIATKNQMIGAFMICLVWILSGAGIFTLHIKIVEIITEIAEKSMSRRFLEAFLTFCENNSTIFCSSSS